jgi:hypothetical protein
MKVKKKLPGVGFMGAPFKGQNCLGTPACFRTAFALWRDLIAGSTGKRRPV